MSCEILIEDGKTDPVAKNVSEKNKTKYIEFVFFLFGVNYFIFFNALCSSIPFFENYMNDYSTLKHIISRFIVLFVTLPLIIGSNCNLFVFYKIHQLYKVFATKMVYLLFATILLIFISLDCSAPLLFCIVIFSAAVCTFVNPIMMASIFIDVGFYGPKSIAFYIAGQGFCAVLAPIVQVILVSFKMSAKNVSILFFGFVQFLGITCITAYFYIVNRNDYQAWKKASLNENIPQSISFIAKFKEFRILLTKKWIDGLTLYLVLTVSLFLFPHLTKDVKSVYENETWNGIFVYICCFVSYGLGDFVGRYTDRLIPFPKPGTYSMLIVASSRFIFTILFLLCNQSKSPILPPYLKHDVFPIFFNFLFGTTGAHLLTICFKVPYSFSTEKEQADSSSLFVMILSFGLTSGAILAFALP